MTQVGTSVVRGLQQASQPPPWPNTREALLELLAILDEWCRRAEETTRFAYHLARGRQAPDARPPDQRRVRRTNLARGYGDVVRVDSQKILKGRVPPLAKLRGSSRRRAARRGLRTILVAYCPDLLEQFEAATEARLDWVGEHREDFNRWFDESHTDEEVAQLLAAMGATEAGLLDVTAKLREFITVNFPLTNTAQGPDRG